MENRYMIRVEVLQDSFGSLNDFSRNFQLVSVQV